MKLLWKTPIWLGVFILGIAFLLLGIFRGEAEVVLRKAITICMECIGIG